MYFVQGRDKVRTAPPSKTMKPHSKEGYLGRSRNYVYKPQNHSYYSKVNMLPQRVAQHPYPYTQNEQYDQPVAHVVKSKPAKSTRRPAPQKAVRLPSSTTGTTNVFKILGVFLLVIISLVATGAIKLPYQFKLVK